MSAERPRDAHGINILINLILSQVSLSMDM